MKNRVMTGVLAGLTIAALGAGSALAQEDEAAADGSALEVTGVEYAFEGLPTSVPAGTNLTFANGGLEIHEMVVNRLADGVTESIDELLAINASGVNLENAGYIDLDFGNPTLLAVSGQTAEGSITLEREGRYVVLCFIPTGLETAKLVELGVDPSVLGPDTDPSTLSPEAQAYIGEVSANPPHLAQGMIQGFDVTAAGTEPGPLPEMDATE